MRECNSCGKCCVKYGNGRLSASQEDIELWESFRPEISEFVKGGQIWFDPKSGNLLDACPWLRTEKGSDRYTCAIYHDRPEDCRAYPANVQDMINDSCEMLEEVDLIDLRATEHVRSKLTDC